MEGQIKQLMEMHSELKMTVGRINDGMKLIDTIQASLERCKLIDGYPTHSVSSYGRVRSEKTGRLLKGRLNNHGYCQVDLLKNGKTKSMKVHRLVAFAFIANPEGKRCVDHMNNCKSDKNVSNLRWAAHTENNINVQMRKDNKSGIKGVNFDKKFKKWRAQIQIEGVKFHLGRFDDIEDAKKARIKKANEAFGAYINSCEK